MLRKKRYQNIDWIGATRGDFLPSGTLFLGSSEQGKWEIWHTVLVVIWLVEVVFSTTHYYRRFDICRRGKRRKWPQRNRSTKCWDKAQHHARTPRNFIGGNPTGSAVKTNGRAGTRTSGSSKGSPELGLANDSRELLTKKNGECRALMVQVLGLSVENCMVSMRHNTTLVRNMWHDALN